MGRLWTSVPWGVACELVSLVGSHVICLDSIVSPLRLHRVKCVCCFSYRSHSLTAWRRSFTCYRDNVGMKLIPKWESVNSREENSPPLLLAIKVATFRSRVQHSTSWAKSPPFVCVEQQQGHTDHFNTNEGLSHSTAMFGKLKNNNKTPEEEACFGFHVTADNDSCTQF